MNDLNHTIDIRRTVKRSERARSVTQAAIQAMIGNPCTTVDLGKRGAGDGNRTRMASLEGWNSSH